MDVPGILIPLLLTLKVAGFATLFALAAGAAAAFVIARRRPAGTELLDAALTLPLVLPPTVLGYYLLTLFGRNGWLGKLLDGFGLSLIFTWQGAVVASAVVSFPLVYKSARAAFEGVDKNLENAARTLGHGEFSLFLLVTLPLAWRGILAGTMLAFARAAGEFGATLMVAGNMAGKTQTLSLAIYDAVQSGNQSAGLALVAVTSALCISVLVLSGRLLRPAN
ncbi:MAG TPA: molybdate ABC transporter permease subunit [Nitrospirota bacterium]|jgi:molybdate transport system permease protein